MYQVNSNKYKASVALLISDKIQCKVGATKKGNVLCQ